MMYDYTIDANARKNIKTARAWIDKVKKDRALSRSKKIWAIFFMARRAQSQGKKRMVLLFKKAMQELRQEAMDEFMRDK